MITAKDYAYARRLDERIRLLEDYCEELESYGNLCFSKRKLKECSFWDSNKENVKKNRGFPQIIDIPEDLGLRELVISRIYDKLTELKTELSNYVQK